MPGMAVSVRPHIGSLCKFARLLWVHGLYSESDIIENGDCKVLNNVTEKRHGIEVIGLLYRPKMFPIKSSKDDS